LQYKSTIRACFAGYVVQAVVNNFVPLLFLTFQSQYGIPLSQVTLLITINFALQLAVDGVSVFFIDRIGYRAAAVIAHICATLGLVGLAFLPDLLPSPFAGLLLSVLLYALGGGLLEVIVSPIVESCPSDHKAQTMSILHSFYCWGSAGVIVISTLFLKIFGASSWKILAAIWALLPLAKMPAGGFIVLGILCAIWRAAAAKRKEYLKKEARDTLTVHYQKEGNREP